MDAKREFTLFRKGPVPPLRHEVVAKSEPARNEPEYTPLQKLTLLIQQKIETLVPDAKPPSREHVKELQEAHCAEPQENTSRPLDDKIAVLLDLSDSLKQLQEKLQHSENYTIFAVESLVKRLRRPVFLASVRNLKSELDKAMEIAPIDTGELNDFKVRADLIRNVIQTCQNYAAEFQKKRLFSEEHNSSACAEIDRLAVKIVGNIKQSISNFSSDIPFFASCLKLFLNDENLSCMSYESCETGWLISKKEHKNPVFHEDILKARVAILCGSLHRGYVQAGLGLAKKIDKFLKDKQSLMQEIDVQLNILSGFQDSPASVPSHCSSYQLN